MTAEFLNRCLAQDTVTNPADNKPLKPFRPEHLHEDYPTNDLGQTVESERYQGAAPRPELVKSVVQIQRALGWFIGVSVDGYIIRENRRINKGFHVLPQDQMLFLAQANDLAVKTGVSIDDAALFLTRHMV